MSVPPTRAPGSREARRSGPRPGVLLLVALLLALVAGCRRGEPAVGVLVPRSGPRAAAGEALLQGVLMAWDEVPAEDRPPLLVEDGRGTALGTAEGLQALVGRGATVILGPLDTENALVAAALAQTLRVPLLSPTALGSEVTRDNGWALRACTTAPELARGLASHARFKLGLDRLAIVADLGDRAALELASALAREFQLRRGRVVGEQDLYAGDPELAEVLDRAVAQGAQGVLLAVAPDDVLAAVRGAGAAGAGELILLGVGSWDAPDLIRALAGRFRGAYVAGPLCADDPAPTVAAFVRAWRARGGDHPPPGAALGYDGARALLTVFARARAGEALRRAMHGMALPDGVTGPLRFDPGGDPLDRPIVLEQLHDPQAPRCVGRLGDG